jgi:predicted PolB exonuclease-like 3'-5' exonuclease
MIICDIETVAIDGAADYLEQPSAPSNYKDQAKIDAYIEEAKRKALDKAALDVDLCRIVAIGCWHNELTTVQLVKTENQERALLETLWAEFPDETFVGFNILDFDLPVLLRRSLYLGVKAPKIDVGKYRHDRVIDLMQVLAFDGKLTYRGLDFYCKRFGIPNDDTMTGADIGPAVARGDWTAVENHCRCDVEKTRALAERIGVLAAVLA